MVYTQHRDTQATLAVIESLDLDGDPPTQEEVSFRLTINFNPFRNVNFYAIEVDRDFNFKEDARVFR